MEQFNQPEKKQPEYKKSSFLSYWTDVFRPGAKKSKNINLKAMHTINKISILMFLVCLVILIVKCVR